MKKHIRSAVVGFLIGVGAVAPGISGGALAVICGYYTKLTEAIAQLFSSPKRSLSFLFPVGLGGVAGIWAAGGLLHYLFGVYPEQLQWGFIGLIVGTLPHLWKDAKKDDTQGWHPLIAIGTMFFALLWSWLPPLSVENMSFWHWLLIGAVLGVGTIVPGISSTCILVFLGLYEHYLGAVDTLNVAQILPMALSFGLAILLLAKLVNLCYQHAYSLTSYAVLGFLVGSAVWILPPMPTGGNMIVAFGVCGGCAALSWFVAHIATKNAKSPQQTA